LYLIESLSEINFAILDQLCAHMMKITLKTLLVMGIASLISACSGQEAASPFVRVEEGQFIRNGQPYTYIGTNFWYGPILASDGESGDYDRLVRELDTLKALGIENLRVLVGGDGPDGVFSRIEPTLQKKPGVYDDTILTGLDRFLEEIGKRGMQAVLYLNNSWEWSGGYGQYLEWATGEPALIPLKDGYPQFMHQMAKFSVNAEAQQLFFNHLKNIVGRTNTLTGKPYSEDPAIFSWQIGNEPRCFSADTAVRDGFVAWLTEAARLIKEIDPNHMVSVGSEGLWGCEGDLGLLEQVTAIPGVDYMTIHIWPYNWGWARPESLLEDIPDACAHTDEYIAAHVGIAAKYGQPIVAEEFGFPRDGFSPDRTATTGGRDAYYRHMFGKVGHELAGANFWGWSGFARPAHTQWQRGDDYAGDPAQEAQGLNGVYVDDTTVETIKQSIINLNN